MGLRSLCRQKRLGLKIEASGKAVDSQPTVDLKTQEIEHGISRTKDTFAQCKCSLPLSRRKDHRFFTFRDRYVGLRRSAESRKERSFESFSVAEEKGEDIMREQELENKAENDKRTPEANCACTLETRGEERIKRNTCVDISARKKLLACDESISPTSETINKEINDSIKRINNSIKEAMQTLVKCSMVSKMQVSTTYL